MKTKAHFLPSYQPTESEIRQKAHELYLHSGGIPGRDLENWLEAKAVLAARAPQPPRTRTKLGVSSAAPHRP